MMIRRLALAGIIALLPAVASAQMAQIAPTAPAGDSSDRIANTQFVQQATGGAVSITAFGAKCDGTTDDAAAINRALAASVTAIVPNASCRASSTIIVAPGSNLIGVTFNTAESSTSLNGPTGSQIICDLTVTPCVKIDVPLSGSSSVGGQTVEHLSITRAAGTIPAGTVCLLDASFKVTVENVSCNGHAIGFETLAQGIFGIVAFFDHIWTVNVTDSDIVLNGFAEMHVDHGRFGGNGARNPTHSNFVKITGGASGPSTLWVNDSQFNDIKNPTCLVSWQNLTVTAPTVSEFSFHGNHYEMTNGGTDPHSIFCSDSTATALSIMRFDDNVILDNDGTSKVWNLNAATALGDWRFHGNLWSGFVANGWNLSPSKGLFDFSVTGDIFNNPHVTVTGPGDGSDSAVTFSNNVYSGGLTIAGDFGPAFPTKFSGVLGGGTVTNTATSRVQIDIPGFSKTDNSAAMTLSFGGSPATLSTNIASWQLQGSLLTWTFFFQVGSVGSGTGAAVLGGLPFVVPGGNGAQLSPLNCSGLAGGGPLYGTPAATTQNTTLAISGGTGIGNATNANFQAGSICTGSISYVIQ